MELSNSVNYLCSTYGDAFADVYDDWYQQVTDVDGTVDLISDLSGGLEVLELGIGTGRLALPIASKGVPISGVDASPEMLKRLTARDSEGLVRPHLANMAEWLPPGPYKVIFCAYNTFFNLVGDDDQERCLSLVSDRLSPDGLFIIEAFVPSNYSDLPTRGVESRHLSDGTVLNITIREKMSGMVRGQSVQFGDNGVVLRPWRIRIKTPDELDQMAAVHGLKLLERWQDWTQSTFTSSSDHHISVYASTNS
ncbi:MAG: class I SAM-dependent methyltransferase [Acidimicrobiales bacterium]|jgi:SAM-dependent methyltransferase|nr:class I SAM-dependent methyltransferase [Acidimicrobiales bacterium]